jgi:tetratricopeptide (TPR) repeat protein
MSQVSCQKEMAGSWTGAGLGWVLAGWALMLWPVVLPGQTVPRAEVVEDDVPRAVPVAPAQTIPRARVVEDSAQAAPRGPDEDLFSYGTMLYEREEYALAARAYADYLQNHPTGRHLPTVLFRIGECLMKQRMEAEAERYYAEVVQRHPNSEGAPSAAYRAGAIRFNARDFEGAVSYFSFCEKVSKVPLVRLAAAYNLSRAYQMQGDKKRQLEALRRVAEVKVDNRYRSAALIALGEEEMRDGDQAKALALFLEAVEAVGTVEDPTAEDEAGKVKAMLNAAVLLGQLKRTDESVALFEKVLLESATTVEQRGIALVGVVQAKYDAEDYDGVVEHFTRHSKVLPDGVTRGRMLLLVGNAYRMKKVYSRAVEIYLLVERDFGRDDAAFEAGYWKLYCFYLLEDKDLGDFAKDFLKRWREDKAEHEFVAKAALILADHYFNRADYGEAVAAFAEVSVDSLSGALRANTLFNHGFALVESERHQDAIPILTRFISENTTHELVANALAHRGVAYRAVKDVEKAIADFKEVTEKYPKSPAGEMAWYQLGLIAQADRNHQEVIRAFENLVKFFPQSQAVPQAWFGIGAAAYEIEAMPKAQEALRRAIRLDAKSYLDKTSQLLVLSYYAKEDAKELANAIDEYRGKRQDAAIAPNVLGWLGLTLFAEEDYKGVVKYLSIMADPAEPGTVLPVIWNYLGMAQVELGQYQAALVSVGHFLDANQQPSSERGKALSFLARAHLGLADYQAAAAACDEGLGFVKTGRLHAELMILSGDILFEKAEALAAAGRQGEAVKIYGDAASKYIVPSQFFVDPLVTPEALTKTVRALEKAGDSKRAETYRKTLQESYPNYPKA